MNGHGLRHAVAGIPGTRPLVARARRSRARVGQWRHDRETERRNAATLAKLESQRVVRLNVGAGGNHVPGWVSIDIIADGVALRMDASKPWPFEAASVDAVNSEHFIEHLDRDGVRAYLGEAFQALRPGGLIRTSTPSLDGLCEILAEKRKEDLATHRRHGYEQ